MSTGLRITTDELLSAIATVAGWSRDYASDWDSTQLADAKQIIRSGLRRFYQPPPIDGGSVHEWRFLEKAFVDNAEDVYSTGTVAVSGGTATLTSGTWPSWAANGILRVDSNSLFVTSRDSGTELTIENDAISVDSGTSYELHCWRFALPTDFGEFLSNVLYNHASYPRCLRTSSEQGIKLRYITNWKTGQTTEFAILPAEAPTGASLGTDRGFLAFWPPMDSEASIVGKYRAVPQDNLDNTDIRTGASSVIQVDAVHAQTVLESVLAATEELIHQDYNGPHNQAFMERLAASIKHDRNFSPPIDFSDRNGLDLDRLARLNHVPTYENP